MYRLTLLSKLKCLAVLSGLLCASAWAAYPERTVTLVVPFTPGSGSDIIARIIAPKLSERWKQAVVVDNKPGASGNIGADAVAKAAPDGHTLLMAINTITMAPNMYKRVPFDPTTDFTPIMKMAVANFAIVVNPQIGAQDLAGVIALAKAKPGQINFGSPGNGTPHHLAMELMKQQLGFDMLHVPYKGISNATTDLIGGQVTFLFVDLASSRPHVQSGRVRALALSAEQKSALAADLPTVAEQANLPGFDLAAWIGVVGPAGMPPAIVNKLSERLAAMLVRKDVAERLVGLGVEAHPSTAAELDAYMKKQLEGWGRKVKDAGIQPE